MQKKVITSGISALALCIRFVSMTAVSVDDKTNTTAYDDAVVKITSFASQS